MSNLSFLSAMEDRDDMSIEDILGQLGECRRLLHLYEIDNKALKSRCEVAENKNEVLEKQAKGLNFEIEKLEIQINNLNIDRAFLREEVAEAKLYTVKLQEILDLKQASDKARLRSWDVFKSLYTIDSSSTELNFIGQRLDDEGAVIVSDTIDVFSSLQTLNLSENVVAAKGMEALSIPLSRKTSLTSLVMQGNKLGDISMASVGVVVENVCLKSLNLSLNGITDFGVAVLANTISAEMPAAASLTSLNLSQNRIGAKGSEALAQALLQNTTLSSLNLADNILADYGTTHLASMLRVNDGITDLNLCNNDIREKGIHELCSAIHDNNKLRTIRLVNNEKMGAEGTKALTALQKSLALTRKMRVYF